jgi:hypothetical protein
MRSLKLLSNIPYLAPESDMKDYLVFYAYDSSKTEAYLNVVDWLGQPMQSLQVEKVQIVH